MKWTLESAVRGLVFPNLSLTCFCDTTLNPTCPHAGCKVDWQKDNSKFVCPCHGSEFDPSGKVISGPAARNLTSYPAKAEEQSILVKLA